MLGVLCQCFVALNVKSDAALAIRTVCVVVLYFRFSVARATVSWRSWWSLKRIIVFISLFYFIVSMVFICYLRHWPEGRKDH